jgi:hypothetical protein
VGTPQPIVCGAMFREVLPRKCVDPSMAQVGTALTAVECANLCGWTTFGPFRTCSVAAIDAESVTIACSVFCVTGRRPQGLVPSSETPDSLGAYFAAMAGLEAASVDAFEILEGELAAHGAPQRLCRAARRAARDEVRHTRITRALAKRFGASAAAPERAKRARRSLEAIALENAVEGCVRETFGALLATWQAAHAEDDAIRAAMTRIATDETMHAALAWDVAAWLDDRLSEAARRRVAHARRAAVEELMHASVANDRTLARSAGLPGPKTSTELARKLADALWC